MSKAKRIYPTLGNPVAYGPAPARTYQSLTELHFPYDYKPNEDDLAEWIEDSQLWEKVVVKDFTEPIRQDHGWLVIDVGFEGTPQ